MGQKLGHFKTKIKLSLNHYRGIFSMKISKTRPRLCNQQLNIWFCFQESMNVVHALI